MSYYPSEADKIIARCKARGIYAHAQQLRDEIRRLCDEKAALKHALAVAQTSRKLWIGAHSKDFMTRLLSEVPRSLVRDVVIEPYLAEEAEENDRQREKQYEFLRGWKS